MESLKRMLGYDDEVSKMERALKEAKEQKLTDQHMRFYNSVLQITRSFGPIVELVNPELRDVLCVFYMILRTLDTIEDNTSIPTGERIPMLRTFYQHIGDTQWRYPYTTFSSSTMKYKDLVEQFHHVAASFLELDKGHQEIIEEITKRMGEGMANFLCQEIETIAELNEYSHYAAGLVGLGLSRIAINSESKVFTSDWEHLANSATVFLQKVNIIKDYLEDINELPKPRMYWPRSIWRKYTSKLEDLQYERNSTEAVHCLNEMITDALIHVKDILNFIILWRDDPPVFLSVAISEITAFGVIVECYNNVQVFRGVVTLKNDLTAKIFVRTKTMADIYGVFYDFSCIMKTKVDQNDPNASTTLKRLEDILKMCRDSGVLHKRKSYVNEKGQPIIVYIAMLVILVAVIMAYLRANQVMV